VYAGGLSLYALDQPDSPRLLGTLEGLGASRQVELWNGHAFVSARPDGLYIVDIRDPARPALVAHVDTIELATGVAVRDGLLCVTCRHMGVELWDVRTPSAPRYVSHILAGEAQSAFLEGSTLYVGDWMNRRIQIFDVSDPARPQSLSAFALDGFADGMFVRDGLCYAVTGHHTARMKNRRKYQNYTFIVPEMFADGYGCGHGMTIFDVSNPREPEFLSEVKLPPLYMGSNDMWGVIVSGTRAYVCDTYNGLFVLDVSDPLAPAFLAHRRLAPLEGLPLTPPSIQRLCHPVAGIAPIRGHILAAGISTGLHLFACEGAEPAKLPEVCFRMPEAIPAPSLPSEVFRCRGQVHAVAFASGDVLAACGDDGLYALHSDAPYAVRHHLLTEGIAHDVQCAGPLVYAAEGQEGLAIYQYGPDSGFTRLGRYRFEGCPSVRQVLPLPEMGMAAVQLDVSRIAILRVSADGKIEHIKTLPSGGVLYHRHLCRAPYQAALV
ncbi:MAG TPA: hypothetical protein PKE04_21055, partial [Clostridia bacterium]|nr:hypothetical protein [Clostridia bacterium]